MKKRFLALLLTAVMVLGLLPVSACAAGFQDISGHWAQEKIEDAVARGYFSGTSANTFSPNAPMTRAMFVTVLYRADGGQYIQKADFVDVATNTWYHDAVCWAYENRIVSGMDSRHFSPDQSITREQMITLLYRYLEYAGATLPPTTNVRPLFYDRGKISPYAREAVEAMQFAEIISGKPAGGGGFNFDPQGRATRAEAACLLCRFFDQMQYGELNTPEAIFEKMEEVLKSDELNEISKAYATASEAGKKECVEQAITYFEMLEEFGEIDDLTVDEANRSLSYKIGGMPCTYLLYDMCEELVGTDGTLSIGPLSDTVIGATTRMAKAAASPSYKALVLESYAATATGKVPNQFHERSTNYQLMETMENCTVDMDVQCNVTLDSLKQGLDDYDIILFNSHGGYSDGEPFIALEEKVTPTKYSYEYYVDRKMNNILVYGSIIKTDGIRFGVRGSFFKYYYDWQTPLKAKWVHLGICKGMMNYVLADGLIAAGADSVTGYPEDTTVLFDTHCVHGMMERMETGGTLQQAVDYAYPHALEQTNNESEKVTSLRPKLLLRGAENTVIAYSTQGKIRIELKPNEGTVDGGHIYTYKLEGSKEIPVTGDIQFTGSSFEIGELEEGATYRVSISADGYDTTSITAKAAATPVTRIVNVTKKQPIDLDPIKVYRTVTVKVEDFDTDTALSGASVTLSGRASSSESYTRLTTGTTNSSGQISASVLSTYSQLKAEATRNGYIRGSTEVTGATTSTSITVTLSKEPNLAPDPSDPDAPSGYTPIYTAADLDAIQNAPAGKYILMNNIDANGVTFQYSVSDHGSKSYRTINSDLAAGGVLDGNGYTISNLKYALFNNNYGTIKNLNVTVDPSMEELGAGLVIYNQNTGVVENCEVFMAGNKTGNFTSTLSGLTYENNGLLRNCVVALDLSIESTNNVSQMPSVYFAGLCYRTNGTVQHCLVVGDVQISGTCVVYGFGTIYPYQTDAKWNDCALAMESVSATSWNLYAPFYVPDTTALSRITGFRAASDMQVEDKGGSRTITAGDGYTLDSRANILADWDLSGLNR